MKMKRLYTDNKHNAISDKVKRSITYRIYLPEGKTAKITTEGTTAVECLLAAFRLAGTEYKNWRGIEVIPGEETGKVSGGGHPGGSSETDGQ